MQNKHTIIIKKTGKMNGTMDLCSMIDKPLLYPWVLLEKAVQQYSSMLSYFFPVYFHSVTSEAGKWKLMDLLKLPRQYNTVTYLCFFSHLFIQSFSGSLFSLLILKSDSHCLASTGSFQLLMALLSSILWIFSYLAFVTVSVFTPAANDSFNASRSPSAGQLTDFVLLGVFMLSLSHQQQKDLYVSYHISMLQ